MTAFALATLIYAIAVRPPAPGASEASSSAAQTEATLERVRVDGPVMNTLHNLIQTLSIKLDSAARYGLYTEDARVRFTDLDILDAASD